MGATQDDQTVRRGVWLLRRILTGTVITFLLVTGPTAGAQMGLLELGSGPEEPRWASKAERLADRYGCTDHGLPAGQVPVHALVRVDGKVRITSFAEGWSIHQARGHDTLMAVCAR